MFEALRHWVEEDVVLEILTATTLKVMGTPILNRTLSAYPKAVL